MLGICQALWYMHTRTPAVIHSDLKPSNIMVEWTSGGPHPKLLDFGLSRVITRNALTLGGTQEWSPQEVFNRTGAKCSADVYSFGLLIFFIATGESPPRLRLQDRRRQARSRARVRPWSPSWSPNCPFKASCKAIVSACLRDDEAQRPDIKAVHGRLLHLPREMNFAGAGYPYIEAMEILATQMDNLERWPLKDEEVGFSVSGHSGSSSSSSVRTPVRRPLALQPATSDGAMETSLLRLISRWNFNYSTSQLFCCDRHAGLHYARQTVSAALAKPCHPRPLPRTCNQCASCGILGVDGPVCDTCGSPQGSALTSL
uniref:Protein kinase domain-containing protein n=1 Tax=Alexandrium monilatum TaxID=311494 RepID=A0A7S4VFB4_9DINO